MCLWRAAVHVRGRGGLITESGVREGEGGQHGMLKYRERCCADFYFFGGEKDTVGVWVGMYVSIC